MCWEEARGLPGSVGPKAWEVERGALMGACCPAPRASPRRPGSPGPVARTRPWGSWVAEPLVPGQGCAGAWRQPGENGLARAAQAPSGGPYDQGLVRRTAWFIPPPRQLLPEHSLYRHLRRGGVWTDSSHEDLPWPSGPDGKDVQAPREEGRKEMNPPQLGQ